MDEPLFQEPDYGSCPILCELYELYLGGCKCDKEDDVCCCLSFEKFCDEHIMEMRDQMGELEYLDQEARYAL